MPAEQRRSRGRLSTAGRLRQPTLRNPKSAFRNLPIPMVALVQRVKEARVEVDGAVVGAHGAGLLVLLGVAQGDTEREADWLADKLARLRVFPDPSAGSGQAGRMNRALLDTGGEALVVSQFTLLGEIRKGTRPSFTRAAPPEAADRLYRHFTARLSEALGRPVPTGVFGAMMDVHLVNDGPVTLWVEREGRGEREKGGKGDGDA